MKTLAVNKRDLINAIAYRTHVDLGEGPWAWEIVFNPKAQEPSAKVVLVHPDVEPDESYVYANEDSFNPLAFTRLDGYRWGEEGAVAADDTGYGKEFETVRVPDEVRHDIEESLLKQVEYDGTSYTVRYY